MSIQRDPTIVLVAMDSPVKRINKAAKVRSFTQQKLIDYTLNETSAKITLLAHSFHKMTKHCLSKIGLVSPKGFQRHIVTAVFVCVA